MSDQYIKMILALPEEFFKGWKWKDGDTFLYRPAQEDEWEIYHIGSFGTMVNNGVIVFATLIEDATPSQGKYRPVPSQEQLQNLLIKFHMIHNRCTRKRAILHIMGHWADYLMRKHDFEYDKIERNEAYEYFGNPEDFDILMLRFMVGIILMLEWNGDSWEKMA